MKELVIGFAMGLAVGAFTLSIVARKWSHEHRDLLNRSALCDVVLGEIVERGYAEWVVVDPVSGRTELKIKECIK